MRLRSLFDKSSLQVQLTLATALLCAVLVFGATLSAAWLGRGKAGALIGADMAELAATMVDRLDRDMFERHREIGIIAGLDSLKPAWGSDPDGLRQVLGALQDSFSDYAWIGFADADGLVRAATRRMLEGQSVAQRPWFAAGLKTAFAGDLHEALLLARLLGPRNDGEPFRFVDVAHPVRDAGGATLGVLGAHLSWDWAAELRRELLASPSHAGAEIIVLDSGGRVLLGPDFGTAMLAPDQLATIVAQGRGHGIDIGPEPGAWLTGYAVSRGHRDYRGLGWIVLARQPRAEAFRPVDDLVRSLAALGAVLALAGIAAAAWLARRMTAPITQLTAEAARIGREADALTLPRVGGAREMLLLSQALRSLLRRIGSAQQRIAQQVDESRELASSLARMQVLAETDPLTGLLNRRAFLAAAERQLAIQRRYGGALAIVVADIDHFKRVNDSHGHATGDVAIRAVAERLRAAARDTDLVARFGGEEFVVLLMASDAQAAGAYAERVRAAIAAAPVLAAGAAPLALTVSFGCTGVAAGDRDVQDAIDRADGALYRAKAAGRNRVEIAAPAA